MNNKTEMKQQSPSLIVLENDRWFWTGFEEFLTTISSDWKVIHPKVADEWDLNKTSLRMSMFLSQPNVTDVAMQTAFETTTGIDINEDDKLSTQFEVLLPVIREVLRFRENNKLLPLTFHVVYNSVSDFISDVRKGKLGTNAWSELDLILRQQDNLTIKLYNS